MRINKSVCVALLCAATILTTGIATVGGAMMGGGGGFGGGPGGGGGMAGDIPGVGEGGAAAQAAIVVETQQAGTGDIELATNYVGKIEPNRSVDIYPEMSAKVLATHAEVGDTVQKGDLLFELDGADARSQVEAAQLSFESAKLSAEKSLGSNYDSQIIQQESTYENAKLSYDKALDSLDSYQDSEREDDLEDAVDSTHNALQEAAGIYEQAQREVEAKEAQLKEQTSLGASTTTLQEELKALQENLATKKNAYTQAQSVYQQAKEALDAYDDGDDTELKNLINAVKAAKISFSSAEQQLALTTGKSLEETQAQNDLSLKQAQLSYDNALKALDKTRAYAPIDGVIEAKGIEEYGNASQQAAAYTITSKGTMRVAFNVSAAAIDSVQIGDAVTVEKGGDTFAGTVVEVGQKLDDTTGLLAVKAQVEAGESSLITGMTVRVSAVTTRALGVITVPAGAISYEDGQAYLFTVTGDTAHKTAVETGASDTEKIEISGGLQAGDTIVTTWHPDLVDGAAITLAGAADGGEETAAAAKTNEASGAGEAAGGQAAQAAQQGAPGNGDDEGAAGRARSGGAR